MDFYEVLDQVAGLLQERKRVTYGALKFQFKLDDEHLEVLKEELIEAQGSYGKVNEYEEGLSAVSEAFNVIAQNAEHMYEAELYRLKGELTFQQESKEQRAGRRKQEVEECFRKAIEIAQKQQAKSLELRATVSLARLWQQQNKQHEAHSMLSDIYNWFTEGFDTRDLQEAKALLEDLAAT